MSINDKFRWQVGRNLARQGLWQMSLHFQTIALAQQGAVLHVTLNRPEVRNAMSLLMVAELRLALEEAEASAGSDHAVRVLVLRGSGGHFCAGADVKDMAAARMRAMQSSDGSDAMAEANAQFGELCAAYAQTPLALVAVLQGTVMGGGVGLACVADIALAEDTAVFRLCLLYTSPSPRDGLLSRMPSSA